MAKKKKDFLESINGNNKKFSKNKNVSAEILNGAHSSIAQWLNTLFFLKNLPNNVKTLGFDECRVTSLLN